MKIRNDFTFLGVLFSLVTSILISLHSNKGPLPCESNGGEFSIQI